MTAEEHEQRLKRIEQLRDCPGWSDYLRPRIADMLRRVETEALTNDALTADRVMLLRAEAKSLRTVLGLADTDARVSAETLRRQR